MYLIVRVDKREMDYFGPFPTMERAEKYAESFDTGTKFSIVPLIVPNCVQVKLMY